MSKLSFELQQKITANPTYTILKDDDKFLKSHKNICILNTGFKINIPIPKEFDGKKIWKNFLSPIKNQENCGSCWAFATTSVLADKFNIQSNGKYNINLSPAKLILCNKDFENKDAEKIILYQLTQNEKSYSEKILEDNIKNFKFSACYGNSIYNALEYLYIIGTCEEYCLPYAKQLGLENKYQNIGNFTEPSRLPLCTYVTGPIADMCSDYFISYINGSEGGTPMRFYRALEIYWIPGTAENNGSEENIKYEIFKWGPVISAIQIYPDFYLFDPKKDIYRWNKLGKPIGGHAIEITGWGVQNNIPYWQIKNSWGSDWGDDGFFKIIRGYNECKIEENIFSVVPDFFYDENNLTTKEIRKEINCENRLKYLRDKINKGFGIIGGGIDPTTGYSRRVMNNFKLNFNRPVPLEEIPSSRKSFVAGELTLNNKKYELKKYLKKKSMLFLSLIIVIFIFLIIYILIKKPIVLQYSK
jgi:cathepsin B